MHINELPDLVLARIFHWVYYDPIYRPATLKIIESWRAKLVLLAVCRKWRELALPSLHRVSFIRCNSIRPKNRGNGAVHNFYYLESSDTQRNSGASDELGDKMCVVKSNLDIIGNTGNRCWPRTVRMIVNSSNNLIYSLQHTIEKLRNHTTLLTKVLRMELEYVESGNIWTDETTNTIGASSIGEEISQLIPHVQYIEFGSHSKLTEFVNFVQSLVKSYTHQLTGFNCPQYALGKVQSFSDKLKHVYIDGDRDTLYMPQICAENLTNLALDYVSRYSDWSSFESNGSSRSLNFPNLKWLRLDVSFEDNNVDGVINENRYVACEFDYKVIAPKLETVILPLCPFTLSFLASIHGLVAILNVDIRLELGQVYFTELDLGIARDKFSSYAKNSLDDFQHFNKYAYMNDMFNMYSLAKSSKSVVRSTDPLDFERMNWKYLLNIVIYSPFHVNDLRTLISKAPSLETIFIGEIDIKENGKLIPEIQDEAATVELLSSSLKTISFEFLIDCTESEKNKFIVYLSKLTPGD